MEVVLATGETGTAPIPVGYFDLWHAVDINDDGHQQVLLSHTQGGDGSVLLVYAWRNGSLIAVQPDSEVWLGWSMHGPYEWSDYHVTAGRLFSWVRVGRPGPDGGPIVADVDTWSWAVEGGRLVATPAGRACVNLTRPDPPQPCA